MIHRVLHDSLVFIKSILSCGIPLPWIDSDSLSEPTRDTAWNTTGLTSPSYTRCTSGDASWNTTRNSDLRLVLFAPPILCSHTIVGKQNHSSSNHNQHRECDNGKNALLFRNRSKITSLQHMFNPSFQVIAGGACGAGKIPSQLKLCDFP